MPFCTECGSKLDGTEKYCGDCGAAAPEKESGSSESTVQGNGEEEEKWLYKGRMSGAGAFLTIGSLLTFGILGILRWKNSKYVVTTERITSRYGVIIKRNDGITTEDIEDIRVKRHFADWMFSVGNVKISSRSRGGAEVTLRQVKNPKQVMEYVEAARDN